MTTSLEEILKRRTQKLPDISQYHYQLTMPASQIEDVNQRNARQEAVRQAHIGSWSRAIYQDKLRNDQGWANDAEKLINAINKVDDVLDKEAENRARDAFRKNYGETEEGHPWVEKEPIDKSKILEGQKELYEINRKINTKIFEGDPSDPEVLELKELGAYKKINRNATEIAQLGFESSLSMYQDLSTQPIYNVQGFGKISFQYAKDKNLRFPDGSSVAEAIRQEIFSDIYVKLGLDKVPLRVLRKNYWGPLQQELTKLRAEEFRQKVQENDTNYKLEKNSSFLTSVIEDAGLAISGSPELKGSDGYLKLWDRGKGKHISVREIIKELKFAEAQGDTTRLIKALRAIRNGNYYSSQKGNERISLDEWADIDGKTGDIRKLSDYVHAQLGRLTSTANLANMEKGENLFKKLYGEPLIEKFHKMYPDGYIPDLETQDKLLLEMVKEAQNDQNLPAEFRHPDNLFLGHNLVASLRARMPLKPRMTDAAREERIRESAKIEDPKLREQQYNYWLNEIEDPEIKQNIRKKKISPAIHSEYSRYIKMATDESGLPKLIQDFFKLHGIEEGTDGGITLQRATNHFHQLFQENLINATTDSDVENAYVRAWDTVKNNLQAKNLANVPYYGVQGGITPERAALFNKDIKSTEDIINGTYKDNKLGYLEAPPTEADMRAINYQAETGNVSPLYLHITRTTFPHMSPYMLALKKQKHLTERKWTDWERDLYKKTMGKDLNEEQWFTDKKQIQEINKVLNALEEKWLIREGIYDPKVDVLGFEDLDLPDRDTGELIQKGKRLNENSSASEIANFVTEANGTDFMEPIFEMMYSKTALNGEGFNHITRKGIFQKKITTEKPLVEHTINEVNELLNGNTSIDRLGVFGFTRREVNNVLNQMNLSEEERATLKFDEKFQGRMMWEKIRFTVNGHNNLTTLNRKELPRLNRKEYKTFMAALQNQQVTLADIEGDYMIWDIDAESEQGTPSSQVLVYSPWHSPDVMHPAIAAYLESADYTELDLTKKHTKKNTAKESAIDQIIKADPNYSSARDRAIKAMDTNWEPTNYMKTRLGEP